jgi:hypothetical protein
MNRTIGLFSIALATLALNCASVAPSKSIAHTTPTNVVIAPIEHVQTTPPIVWTTGMISLHIYDDIDIPVIVGKGFLIKPHSVPVGYNDAGPSGYRSVMSFDITCDRSPEQVRLGLQPNCVIADMEIYCKVFYYSPSQIDAKLLEKQFIKYLQDNVAEISPIMSKHFDPSYMTHPPGHPEILCQVQSR